MLGLKNIIPPSVVQCASELYLLDGSTVLLGVVGTRVRVYTVHGTSASCPPSRHHASDSEGGGDYSGFLSLSAFTDVCASDTVEELWDELDIGGVPVCLQPLGNQCFVVITSDSDVVVARYQANLDATVQSGAEDGKTSSSSSSSSSTTTTTQRPKELAWAVLLRKSVLGCASMGRHQPCAEPRIAVSDAGDVAACHVVEGEVHIVSLVLPSGKGGTTSDSCARRIHDSTDSNLIELPLLDKPDVSEAMDEELLLNYSPIDLIAMKRGTKPYPDYFLKKLNKNAATRGTSATKTSTESPLVRFYSVKNDKLSNVVHMLFLPSSASWEFNSTTSRTAEGIEKPRKSGIFGFPASTSSVSSVSESFTNQIRKLVPLQTKALASYPSSDSRTGRDAGRLAVLSGGSRDALCVLDIPAWSETDRRSLAMTKTFPLIQHLPYLVTCDWLPTSVEGALPLAKDYRSTPLGLSNSTGPYTKSLLAFCDNGDGYQYLLRTPLVSRTDPRVSMKLAKSPVRVSAAIWAPHYPHFQKWQQQMRRRKEKNADVCTAESDSFFSAVSFPPSTLPTAAPSVSSFGGTVGAVAGDALSRSSDAEEFPEQVPSVPLEDDHVLPPQRELWLMLSDGGIVIMTPEQLARIYSTSSIEANQGAVEDWKTAAIEGLPYSFSPVFMLPYGGVGCMPYDNEKRCRTLLQPSHRTDVAARWILLGDRWSGVYIVDTLFRRVSGRLTSNGWMTGVALDRDHNLYVAHVNGVVKRIVPTFTPETLCAAPTFENIGGMIPLRSRQKNIPIANASEVPEAFFLAVSATRSRPISITSSSFEEVEVGAGVVQTDAPTLAVYQWNAYMESATPSTTQDGAATSLYPLLQCTKKGVVYQGKQLSFQDLGFGDHVATHAHFYNQHLFVAAYGSALGVVRIDWSSDKSFADCKRENGGEHGKDAHLPKKSLEHDGGVREESLGEDEGPERDGFLYDRPPNSLEMMKAKVMDAEVCCIVTVPLYSTKGTRRAQRAAAQSSGEESNSESHGSAHSVAKRMMALMAVVVGFWNETVVVYTGLDLTPHRTLRTHSIPRMLVNLADIGFITVSLDNGQVVLWDGIAPHSGSYYVSGAGDGVPHTSRHVFCQDLDNWKPTGQKAWRRAQERNWIRVMRMHQKGRKHPEQRSREGGEHEHGDGGLAGQAGRAAEDEATAVTGLKATNASQKAPKKSNATTKRPTRPEDNQKGSKRSKKRAAKRQNEKDQTQIAKISKGAGKTKEQGGKASNGSSDDKSYKRNSSGVLYPINDNPPVIVLYDSHGTSPAPTVVPCIDYEQDFYYYTGDRRGGRSGQYDTGNNAEDDDDDDERFHTQILIIAENEAQFVTLSAAGMTKERAKVTFDVPPATHVGCAVALHVVVPPSPGVASKSDQSINLPQRTLFVALSCNDGHIRVCPLVNLTTDGSIASLRSAPQRSRVERTTCIRTGTSPVVVPPASGKPMSAVEGRGTHEPAGMLTHMIHLPAAYSLLAVTLSADGVSSLVGMHAASLTELDRLPLTMNGGESVTCICRARHSFPHKSEEIVIGSVSVQTPTDASLAAQRKGPKGYVHVVSALPLRIHCTVETPSGPVNDVTAFHKRRKGVRQDYVAVACGSSVCVYAFVGTELQLVCSSTFSQACISVSFTGTYLSCGLENAGVVLVQFITGYGKKTAAIVPAPDATQEVVQIAPTNGALPVEPHAPQQRTVDDCAPAPKKQCNSAAAPNSLKASKVQWFDLSRRISEPLDSHTVVKQVRLNEETIVRIDMHRNVEVVKIERATDDEEIAAHNFFTESLGNVVGMTGGSSSALDACFRLPSTPCAVLVSEYSFNKIWEHTPVFLNFNPEMEGAWSVSRTTRNVLIACQDGSLWSLSGIPVEQSRLFSRLERSIRDGLRVFSKAERWCRSSDRETGSALSGGTSSTACTKRIRVANGIEVGRAFRGTHRVLRSRNVISMDLITELLHVFERWRDFEGDGSQIPAAGEGEEAVDRGVKDSLPPQRCQPSPFEVAQRERELIREKYNFFLSLLEDDETLQLESELRVTLDMLATVMRHL